MGGAGATTSFQYISNLLHPRTLDESLVHDGSGEVSGIKTRDGNWDLRGHRSRIVDVDDETLALFASLYDMPGTPALEARLPVVHSAEVLAVLGRLGTSQRLGGPSDSRWMTSREWHESDRTKDGTLLREAHQPDSVTGVVVSGPQFYVANPVFKAPNIPCRHNQDYQALDHMRLPSDFVPRSRYRLSRGLGSFPEPTFRGRGLFTRYRHVHREMSPPTGARTLAGALLPPGVSNVNAVFGMAFANTRELVMFSGFCASLVADFFIKSTGGAHINVSQVQVFPTLDLDPVGVRTLRLNCLTVHYADLWRELYDSAFWLDTHTKPDDRLPDWTHLGPEWTWDTPLRTPFARRQALVELDALAALALGLTADELCLIYRIQFPVLQGYEADTWYDRRGRIVFTNNRGLNGVGLSRKDWNAIRGEQRDPLTFAGVAPLPDFAQDALGPYEPPFDRCDREADMRQAYDAFVRRGVGQAE